MHPANALAYLEGPFAPVQEEHSATDLMVIEGEIPRDLCGTFARNGTNPRFPPKGRYHWFDGDGMIHAVRFEDGKARYQNRWIRTDGYNAEEKAGEPLWTGILERPDFARPGGPFKNTANTDLVFHAGKLLALWWQSGDVYAVRLGDLATLGKDTCGGALKGGYSAHPKVDPRTGELVFMRFGLRAPFLEHGVVSKAGELAHRAPVEISGPRFFHDIAITERYTILLDMPLIADAEAAREGKTRVRFHRDLPTRFGIVPRHGTDVRWFEASPSYVYHTINAWEEGSAIVLVGCKIENPLAFDPENPTGRTVPLLGIQRLEPFLYRWRFDLETGETKEEKLDDRLAEFPRMDNRLLGVKSRFSYNQLVAEREALSFIGVVKYAHEEGRATEHRYPAGMAGGETVFAPRVGSKGEDDGYLLTFVVEEATGASWVYVLDAKEVDRAPLAKVKVPWRVPLGYHTWWISSDDEKTERARA